MIGSLDSFKQAIGSDDGTRDGALTILLDAATLKVLDRCGYEEADTSGVVSFFRKLKYNRQQILEKKPVVDGTLVIEGRALGQSNEDWTKLVGDLLDPTTGKFLVLGAQNWWPPTQEVQPRFMRWRDPEWPIIRCTYDVTGIGAGEDAPEDLIAAVYALAGYWSDVLLAGAATSEQAGQLRRELDKVSMPTWVESMLGRHTKGRYATWR